MSGEKTASIYARHILDMVIFSAFFGGGFYT